MSFEQFLVPHSIIPTLSEYVSRRYCSRGGSTNCPTLAPDRPRPLAKVRLLVKYWPNITNPLPNIQALPNPEIKEHSNDQDIQW